MSENCRFCLKNMDFCDKFHEINDEIKNDFMHVTNIELLVSGCYINIICEMCLRSLQLASILKTQLIENQEKFHRDFEFSTTKFEDEFYEEPAPTKKRKRSIKKRITTKQVEKEAINEDLVVEITVKEENPLDTIIFENPQINDQVQSTFPCQICNKHFKDKIRLDKHQITHSTERGIVCTACGKKFKRSENLKAHMLHHSDPKYQCDLCGKAYFEKSSLHHHVRSNHIRSRAYECKFCSKSYFKNNSLNRHIKSIHKKHTYFCGFPGCLKDFNYKHHCKLHIMRIHRSVKFDEVLNLVKQNTTILDTDDGE